MKKVFILVLVLLSIMSSCKNDSDSKQAITTNTNYTISSPYIPRDSIDISLQEFEILGTTIRAIEVINDTTIWFAGSNGKWGYTEDGGANWTVNFMIYKQEKPHFRSIAIQENGDVFLVSIQNPARIFKSNDKGITWNVVYSDTSSNAFFDAVEFYDNNHGVLLGDPIDSCFHLAITSDGGDTWQKVDCENIPISRVGEAPFAASNTNIAISGSHAWYGTGGTASSRVYHSPDYGQTWTVSNTPITSGQTMTGIYSIDFYDEQYGIIAGGNWDDVSASTQNIAITNDGGISWRVVDPTNTIGYVSCIQFIPETEGSEIFVLSGRATDNGSSSMNFSNNGGVTWQTFPNTNYLSVQFTNKNTAWVSGKNKIGKLTISSK